MSPDRSEAQARRGILLANLGSPDSPSEKDVRKYLDEFLMDKYVLDVPYLLRRFIVSCFILPKRPKQSGEAYRSIWWEEGSPLIEISRRVQRLLQSRLPGVIVGLAMRYGNPSTERAIRSMLKQGGGAIDEILLVPLYPHYAMSTIGSTIAHTRKVMAKINPDIKLDILAPYYENDLYIEALAESMRARVAKDYDHLLFSYHGLPERHLRKTDPTGAHCLKVENCCHVASPAHRLCYRHQVYRTTAKVVERLGIPDDKYSVAFQSRLGRDPWLTPFTAAEIERFGKSGVGRLLVVCPAFVSDCLETLEEIGIGGKAAFLEAGGKSFEMIPCLNEQSKWIDALEQWCTGSPALIASVAKSA